MTSSLSAVTALLAYLADAGTVAVFEALGQNAGLSLSPTDSRLLVFLYKDVPVLARFFKEQSPEHFHTVLKPEVRGSGTKAYLANVQSGLIELMRRPDVYAVAVQHCPPLAELLEIPAFGWRAYDELLNDGSPRCFGERFGDTAQDYSPGRSISRFATSADQVDAVFITSSRGGYYAERFALNMPKPAPVTFGEELQALDLLGHQALELFWNCLDRGTTFHDQAPASMHLRSRSEWRKAVHFESRSTCGR